MAVDAIDFSDQTDARQLVTNALRAFRDAREDVLHAFAVVDIMRDSGSVTSYLQAKTGTSSVAEATKLFNELSSLKSKIDSVSADTLGAAILQICAKIGV